jgi:TAP-like protein
MLLQRALAYAEAGELQPLALLFYVSLGLDPQTLRVRPDPSYSDATYYAVNCNDYRYFAGTPDERAHKYMQSGDKSDSEIARMTSVYYGDLPCVFWTSGDPAPFDAMRAAHVPTLVLVATADPATPANQGRDVFRRLSNAALIVQQNGPHVIFARGDSCIDAPVTAFLVDGALPAQKETRCAGEIVDAYKPIAPARVRRFGNVLDALISAELEIMHDAGYYAWTGGTPLQAACLRGGAITFDRAPRGSADLFALDNCAFSAGFVMNGSARFQFGRDRFTLTVDISGDATGALEYTRTGARHRVTGTLNGQKIDLSR